MVEVRFLFSGKSSAGAHWAFPPLLRISVLQTPTYSFGISIIQALPHGSPINLTNFNLKPYGKYKFSYLTPSKIH